MNRFGHGETVIEYTTLLEEKVCLLAHITINDERCKSCGLCIKCCPKNIISLSEKNNLKGYKAARVIDAEKCNGCGHCYIICPDICIEVYR